MAKKYVVNIHAEDGIHSKSFTKFERALEYFEKQFGQKRDAAKVSNIISNRGFYSVSDDWGRSIEITYIEVGTCKVCKKKNAPLYGIRITKRMHPKITDETSFNVCIDCADGYECGCWDVVQDGKTYIIVQDDY